MKALIAAATLAIAFGTPALAEPRAPKPVSETATQDALPAPKVREQRVCLIDTPTGTRIARKDCHTRAQWRAMDVDLPKNL